MSHQQNSAEEGVFGTLVVGALLIAGALIGGALARHLLPDSSVGAFAGILVLPLGFIIGLSIAQGVAPPMALLNLFSVLDGRHSVDQILPQGGVLKLRIWGVLGPVLTAVVISAVLTTFVKPVISLADLATRLGLAGAVFGIVMVLAITLLTPE